MKPKLVTIEWRDIIAYSDWTPLSDVKNPKFKTIGYLIKKDKEQVTSWSVVVKKEKNQVNLYCPDCWNKAAEIVDDFKKRVEERNDH